MKKTILIALVSALTMAGCKKDHDALQPATKSATNMNELVVAKTFDWSTARQVQLKVSGMQSPVAPTRLLTVKSTDGKTVYFSAGHTMSQNLDTKITLPTSVKEVRVEFGSIVKTVQLSGNTIYFDFTKKVASAE